MSIIREIKAAWRWVFNIKPKVGELYGFDGLGFNRVRIVKNENGVVFYRPSGTLNVMNLRYEDFRICYRKIL